MASSITPCKRLYGSIATYDSYKVRREREISDPQYEDVDYNIDQLSEGAAKLKARMEDAMSLVLEQKWRKDGHPHGEKLLGACDRRDYGMVDTILKASKNPKELLSTGNEYGETPLHTAVGTRQYSLAQTLLEAGANPNIATVKFDGITPEGATPLYIAAKKGDLQMCRLLMLYKAEVDLTAHPELKPFLKTIYSPVALEIANVTGLPQDVSQFVLNYQIPEEKTGLVQRIWDFFSGT